MLRSATQWAAAGVSVTGVAAAQDAPAPDENGATLPSDGKSWRIGVISARRDGKPQNFNGHTYLRVGSKYNETSVHFQKVVY